MTHRRRRASLLWGLVGTLSFLVLVQGYELVASPGLALTTKVGVALAVGVVAGVLSYLGERFLEPRLS